MSARKNETRSLLNYGFRFFETSRVFEPLTELARLRIWKGRKITCRRINPCGYEGLAVTSMARLEPRDPPDTDAVGRRLLAILSRRLVTSGQA